jgi:Reverse transcriptase (RNA-dependent DNA polymerase)
MVKSEVWSAVNKGMLNKNDKILTTTWAMKKKANRKYRARINACGFKQKDGLHYNSTNTSSPITNDTTIRIMFTILIQMGWKAYVIDVKGASLMVDLEMVKNYFSKFHRALKSFMTTDMY